MTSVDQIRGQLRKYIAAVGKSTDQGKILRLQEHIISALYHVIVVWVVALASQKGGSGKTTLACSLAAAAVEFGLNVAMADADPQGSISAWYKRRNARFGPDVVSIPLSAVRDAVAAGREQYDMMVLDTPGRMTASNDALRWLTLR